MEYQEIKDWLDKLIANNREQKALQNLNSSISTVSPGDHILLYSGIDIIADVLGLPLCRKKIITGDVRYTANYNGMELIQIGEVNEKQKDI